MIPTREQFKEFMAFVQNAQEKEDKVNDAFELIWDEEQAQHVPFYISPWWKVVRYAFCLLFNLKFNKLGIDDVLEWWMDISLRTDASGYALIDAFKGDYRISSEGKEATAVFADDAEMTVQLS